ncbi:MAG: ABC transporter permease [Clostridium sp.]|nr:ABC transporter permease [Clostridium sp.]
MNFIYLTLINIKRYFRNPIHIIATFLTPILMIIPIKMGNENTIYSVGIIDKDESLSSKLLIEKINNVYDTKICTKDLEDNISYIKKYELGALIVIESGFEEKIKDGKAPIIKEYKSEAAKGVLTLEDIINTFIKGETKNIKIKTIIENTEDDSGKILVMLLCYMLLIMSSFITRDMIEMKTSKVMKRNVSTINSDKEIIGSILFSAFILHVTSIIFSLIIGKVVFKIPNIFMGKAILSVILMGIFAIALSMAVSRWVNNCGVGNVITLMVALVSLALGITALVGETYITFPDIFLTFQIISPIYWVNEIISNRMLFKGTLIILLMSLVLFTLGDFKLKDFIE